MRKTCNNTRMHPCIMCLPILYPVQSFFTLVIKLFTIDLIKCSVLLKSTFYLLYVFHKFTFSFACTYYLLNTLKGSPDHSVYEVLQVFLLFYMYQEIPLTLRPFKVHYSKLIFAKPVFNTIPCDFTELQIVKLILFSIMTKSGVIDLPKHLQCLVDRTLRLFRELTILATLKQLYRKEFLTQMFSCDFCEVFRKTNFIKQLYIIKSIFTSLFRLENYINYITWLKSTWRKICFYPIYC